jgi:hypothetical protein
MYGTNLDSLCNCPPSVIPEGGQISDHGFGAFRSDSRDVFQEHETGSKLICKSDDFPIKTGTLSRQALSRSCHTEILAGESTGDDINFGGAEFFCGKSFNVVPNWCVGQLVVGHPRQEHANSKRVLLAVGDGAHPWIEGQGKASDSRE